MISRLYIKIFLFFIVLLFVAGILVGVLFHLGPERDVRKRLERTAETLALLAGDMLRAHLTAEHTEPFTENKGLRDALFRLAEILDCKVWLTGPDGNTQIKTFDGNPPEGWVMVPENLFKTTSRVPVYSRFIRKLGFQIGFPLETPQGRIGVHVLIHRYHDYGDAGGFFLGLFVIGLIIAAIVFPISRTITKPINRLRNSALRIAEGDLSHRVDVCSKNEIGSLGRAFNRMADKVERMVRGGRELTANMSHELRTPLARIRVAGDLLERKLGDTDDPYAQKYLESIREDVDELDRLIGRLLDLSKQDLREEPFQVKPVNLAEMVTELLARYEPALGSRSLFLEKDFAADCRISVDLESIRTAISAVMDNAVRFAPEGGLVRVSAGIFDDYAVIRVANRTSVWPEGDLGDLFEPFHRAPKDRGGGYGLGLAITKKIVEKHGGKITADRDEDWFVIEISLPPEGPKT